MLHQYQLLYQAQFIQVAKNSNIINNGTHEPTVDGDSYWGGAVEVLGEATLQDSAKFQWDQHQIRTERWSKQGIEILQ